MIRWLKLSSATPDPLHNDYFGICNCLHRSTGIFRAIWQCFLEVIQWVRIWLWKFTIHFDWKIFLWKSNIVATILIMELGKKISKALFYDWTKGLYICLVISKSHIIDSYLESLTNTPWQLMIENIVKGCICLCLTNAYRTGWRFTCR